MFRSQRLLLSPTTQQSLLMSRACGLSRFAWNWALALCQRHYEWFGDMPGYRRLTANSLTKRWNTVKDRHFPWVREFSKLIPEESFRLLDRAYQAAFARLKRGQKPGFPRFHKKGRCDSFQVVPSCHHQMGRHERRFQVPRIGRVKVQTHLRWPDAKQVSGRVKSKAGRWWLCLSYELPDPEHLPAGRPACGIDLGCDTFATVASEGKIVIEEPAPKPFAKAKRRLRRASRVMARRKLGSSNRRKAVVKRAKVHSQVANARANFLHQLSARLVRRFGTVVLEDLCVKGLACGWISRTVADLGLGTFRQQVEYKAAAAGTTVVIADRFYPSSKRCSTCGVVKASLALKERVWTCVCGTTHDRDHNAARNLEQLPQGMGKVTPVES